MRFALSALVSALLLSANVSFALSVAPGIKGEPGPANRYRQCTEACLAYNEPGAELRACIRSCDQHLAREKAVQEYVKKAALSEQELLAMRCHYVPELCQ